MTTILTKIQNLEVWEVQVIVIGIGLIVMFCGMIWEACMEENKNNKRCSDCHHWCRGNGPCSWGEDSAKTCWYYKRKWWKFWRPR